MFKLLFIDDEQDSLEPVLFFLQDLPDYQIETCDFDEVEERLDSFQPDIVVLDILRDGSSPGSKPIGVETLKIIWDQRFCPIVIYSAARPDMLDDAIDEHPFVKRVEKGSGSEEEVEAALREFHAHVDVLKQTENEVRRFYTSAIQSLAPIVFRTFDDTARRIELIGRSGRRRLAALVDDPIRDGKQLYPWEQYLLPPISDNILLGDILREEGKPGDDPESFRVVVTPSCDLFQAENRNPKVESVLVAKCYSMKKGLSAICLSSNMSVENKKKLKRELLTRGYKVPVIAFPKLDGHIPTMTANLRKLDLIPIGDVEEKYTRITSIDSPFRELVAWAYMQTTGRLGLPDRDMDSWLEEIEASVASETSEESDE